MGSHLENSVSSKLCFKMASGSEYLSMSSKTTPYRSSLELFPFVKQLAQVAGLIEDHLDLGPSPYDGSSGSKKHLA